MPDGTRKTTRIVVEEGGLEFVTPDGRALAALTPHPGGAALVLHAADGGSVFLVAADGFLSVSLRDPMGEASLTVGDHGGIVSVGRGDQGGAVADMGGMPMAALRCTPEGGALDVRGGPLAPAAVVQALPEGGSVAVYRQDGALAVEVGVFEGEGAVVPRNATGGVPFAVEHNWRRITVALQAARQGRQGGDV